MTLHKLTRAESVKRNLVIIRPSGVIFPRVVLHIKSSGSVLQLRLVNLHTVQGMELRGSRKLQVRKEIADKVVATISANIKFQVLHKSIFYGFSLSWRMQIAFFDFFFNERLKFLGLYVLSGGGRYHRHFLMGRLLDHRIAW